MRWRLPLLGWTVPENEPAPAPRDLGDEVRTMIDAKVDMLKARLRARSAFLRAQAMATDSIQARDECNLRAAEVDFLLSQIEG